MPNLLQKARELAAEIVLRDRTQAGAESAARNFDKVGDSAEKTGQVVERTEKINESAARSYERLQKRLDPLAAAQQRMERDEKALTRAREQGVITTDRYERNLRQLRDQFKRTEDRIKSNTRAQSGLNRETQNFGRVLGAAKGAVAGFFAAFSFGAVTAGTRRAIADLDSIAKKARSLGGIQNAEFLQSSRFALGQLGFDEATSDKALSDFQRRIGELKLNTGQLRTILRDLDGGEVFGSALKNARTLEQQFDIAIEKLGDLEEAERAAVANALFGRAGKLVGALTEAGKDGFRALRKEAEDAGLVIDRELLERAEVINDRFSKATQIVSVQLKQAFLEIAPIVVGIAEQAAKLARSVASALRQQNARASGDLSQQYEDQIIGIGTRQSALSRQRTLAERELAGLRDGSVVGLGLLGGGRAREIDELEARIAAINAEFDILGNQIAGLRAAQEANQRIIEEGADSIKGLGSGADDAADNLDKLSDAAKRAATKQLEDDIARAERAGVDFARDRGGSINDQRQVFADVFERALKQFQPEIDADRLAQAVASADSRFSQELLDEASQQNETLDRIEENTADRTRDESFLDRFSQIADRIIRPLDQMAGGFDQLRGALSGDGSLLDKVAGAGQGLGNILSGAGDSLSKVFGDSLAGLSSVLGKLGPIAGAIGAGANLAASAVSFFKELFGKRSDFTAQAVFDGGSGRVLGTGQDKGAEDNAKARDAFIESAAALTRQLLDVTGGKSSALINVAFRSDRKTGDPIVDVGYQGPAGEPVGGGRFTDVEDAIAAAVRLTADRIKGGDRALVEAAQELLKIGTPVDDVVAKLRGLSDVLKSSSDVVDPLAARIDKVVEAFEGLETRTGALGGAFGKVIDQLAADVEAETARALTADLNPQLGAIEQLLREQAARREEIDRLEGLGGNVDVLLVREFQRRQILNQFNVDDRFREASDPAKFAIEDLLRNQQQEREAFRRAIAQSDGLVGQADYLGLIRAQEAERQDAFRGLSDEDKLRLAGRADEFTNLEGQYALTVDRLLEETARLVDGFEDERTRLQDVVATRGNEINTLDQAIRRLGDTGAPRQSVDRFRADLEDIGNRALTGDEETKRLARAELPAAVDAYVQRLDEVYASGPARDNGVAFARDLLTRVRDQAAEEKSAAERQLETLDRSRDLLEEIRDLMAAPQLNVEALVKAASQFDQDSPFAVLAFQLADLEARQTAQSERLVAVLEQIAAGDVGLGATPDGEAFTGAAPASGFDAGVSGADASPAVPTQSSNSQASSRDADVVQGLIDIAQAVDEQTGEIVSLEKRRERRDARIEGYLKTIATTRSQTL